MYTVLSVKVSFHFSGMNAWVCLLGFMLIGCLGLYDTAKQFQSGCGISHCHQRCGSNSVSVLPHQPLVFSLFLFVLAVLGGVWWPFIMFLIGISLMGSYITIFSCVYLPSMHLYQWSDSLCLLAIFELDSFFIVEFSEFFIYSSQQSFFRCGLQTPPPRL